MLSLCMFTSLLSVITNDGPGGHFIRNPCVRTHTVQYLRKVDEAIRWKTSLLVENLQTKWDQEDLMSILS